MALFWPPVLRPFSLFLSLSLSLSPLSLYLSLSLSLSLSPLSLSLSLSPLSLSLSLSLSIYISLSLSFSLSLSAFFSVYSIYCTYREEDWGRERGGDMGKKVKVKSPPRTVDHKVRGSRRAAALMSFGKTLIYICHTQTRWCKWVPGRN